MSKEPFFSVVIPVYNSEKYLNECIKSVFAQTCDDFELILVDDESKDSSPAICDSWGEKYPDKVRVIHQKNTGVYIAKRNGIKATLGKYIYVIDNDDLITTSIAFESIKDKINETNCDLVFFNATDNIKTGHLLCQIPLSDGQVFENESLSIIYDNFLSSKDLHHIWMMVFARGLFDWEYEYKETFRMLRDGPSLVLPIISNASKILYLNKTIYFWRIQNQASASKHYDVITFFYGIRALHKRILEYSKDWKSKSVRTDDLIRKNYIADICISAIKVRSISKSAGVSRRECLSLMANDEIFRSEYTLKNLEMFRRPVAWALYHRRYALVNIISSLVGIAKGR